MSASCALCLVLFGAALNGLEAQEHKELPTQPAGTKATNSTGRAASTMDVTLFFGGGSTDPMSRVVRERTGMTPYDTNQVMSLVELRGKALEQLKKEKLEVTDDYSCSATIEMSTGFCCLRFTKGLMWCQVEIDSDGRIIKISGGTGMKGKGYWMRDYSKNPIKIVPK